MNVLFIFFVESYFGSFFSVLYSRYQPNELDEWQYIKAVILYPSRCDHCDKRLNWFLLIPIFSAVMSLICPHFRCSQCKKRALMCYLLWEFGYGLICIVAYLMGIKMDGFSFIWFIVILSLPACLLIDVKWLMIPNLFLLSFYCIGLIHLFIHMDCIMELFASMLCCILMLWLPRWVYLKRAQKEIVGFCDIQLIASLSSMLSISAIPRFLFCASSFGLMLFGYYQIKNKMQSEMNIKRSEDRIIIPFVPCLSLFIQFNVI